MAPSSSGLGYRPLTPKTRVRVPLGLFRWLSLRAVTLAAYVRRLLKSVCRYYDDAAKSEAKSEARRCGSSAGGDGREPAIIRIPDDVKAQAVAHGGVSYRAPSGQTYLVIHHEGAFRVFVNRCPHRHLRLDRSGRVLRSADQKWIVCGVHGERFDPLTGQCVSARCAGKYLQLAADVVL
jgi:nitrite reductase/ring-hydroxylating ferredoxin subunit